MSSAEEEGRIEISEILLTAAAERKSKAAMARALRTATESGKLDKIRELLSQGANPDGDLDEGNRPLTTAVMAKNIEAANLLLDAGANPVLPERYGSTTAFNLAAHARHPNLVQSMIRKVEKREDKSTMLIILSGLGYLDFVKQLTASGADVNAVDS